MAYNPYTEKSDCLPQFWKDKYEKEAPKFWDKFYLRNQTNFFKDRHWLDREFADLRYDGTSIGNERKVVLEVGCGVGNAIFPILESNPAAMVYGFDFSPNAIQLVKSHPLYASGRCVAEVCDIVHDEIPACVPRAGVDVVLLCFVLSAIAPEHFMSIVHKLKSIVRPGGCVVFRDYAAGDLAMSRFQRACGKGLSSTKIDDRFFVRQDGTRSYFFETDEVRKLFTDASFVVESCAVFEKEVVNRKQDLVMHRKWLQGEFRLPK
eukprot:Rmarinus@m.15081